MSHTRASSHNLALPSRALRRVSAVRRGRLFQCVGNSLLYLSGHIRWPDTTATPHFFVPRPNALQRPDAIGAILSKAPWRDKTAPWRIRTRCLGVLRVFDRLDGRLWGASKRSA